MKQPRLADFDPTTKPAELQSPLDDMPAIEKPGHAHGAPPSPSNPSVSPLADSPADSAPNSPSPYPNRTNTERPDDRPLDRPSDPATDRPTGRIGKRIKQRHSFEYFLDQIESLQGFALDEKQRGEQGSMSAMVREALDAYIAKRRRFDGGYRPTGRPIG